MNKSHVLLSTVALMAAFMASPAVAQADPTPAPQQAPQYRWEKLGERHVDAKADRDVIHVGRDDGAFTAIQIQVDGSALAMFEIKVVFGNGETFEPSTRVVFSKDSRSRVIDLPGNKRVIKRVEFKYRDLPGGGKAKIELWGANPTTSR